MTDQSRYLDVLEQLEATITAPWESLSMTLDMHPFDQMGDPTIEGTGAWHLVHIATVFRTHAKHVVGEAETDKWSALPDPSTESLPMIVEVLMDDCQQFCQWCRTNPQKCTDVQYGENQTFNAMLGVMLRHIVWHAGAVHYWCIWKS
tara:strand:+ start:593273 stop:593713 length:441 start_codon:yes stop_codon:yes gene_type:complete